MWERTVASNYLVQSFMHDLLWLTQSGPKNIYVKAVCSAVFNTVGRSLAFFFSFLNSCQAYMELPFMEQIQNKPFFPHCGFPLHICFCPWWVNWPLGTSIQSRHSLRNIDYFDDHLSVTLIIQPWNCLQISHHIDPFPYNWAPSVMAITIYTSNRRCVIVAATLNCTEISFLAQQCIVTLIIGYTHSSLSTCLYVCILWGYCCSICHYKAPVNVLFCMTIFLNYQAIHQEFSPE